MSSCSSTVAAPAASIPLLPRRRLPEWLKVQLPTSSAFTATRTLLDGLGLHTVCESAKCPNHWECWSKGTATFMIAGDRCTRACGFCAVSTAKPLALEQDEPQRVAEATRRMGLKHVVITSVDRDDLRDGGAQHFADCIREARILSPGLKVEVLVPDFRGRMAPALEILTATPPDVFNHNMETIPRLYREARPGANYEWSLKLLKDYKALNPNVPTKSGLMVGLGETKDELLRTLDDLRAHDVEMLTVGQYLQPSASHLPVDRFVHPDEFAEYKEYADSIGFAQAACGPLVRSSYHADKQARGESIN